MGKNIKQHGKARMETMILTPEGKFPRKDFELVQCRNPRGGNKVMWWVSKKNPEKRFVKRKGDEIVWPR